MPQINVGSAANDSSGELGPRGWLQKINQSKSEWYNIVAYGAKGDGTTNDTLAINTAIIAANAAGGGTVYVPPVAVGKYYLVDGNDVSGNGPVTMLSNVRLCGDGIQSIIQRNHADNKDVIFGSAITNFEIDHLQVVNATANGATQFPANSSAIAIRITNGSSYGHVHHCWVTRSWIGIAFLDVTGGLSGSHHCECDHNICTSIGNNGIGINSRNGQLNVHDNIIDTFGTTTRQADSLVAAAIELRGCTNSICSRNIITNGNYDGTNPTVDGVREEFVTEAPQQRCSNNIIAENSIFNVSGHGIRVNQSSRTVYGGNSAQSYAAGGSGAAGLLLTSSVARAFSAEDNLVVGNQFIAGAASNGLGISLISDGASQPTRRNLIAGNRLENGQNNIQVVLSDDNQFLGNVILTALGVQVLHISGNRNTYKDNLILNGAASGLLITAGDSNRVLFNEIYGATQTFNLNLGAGSTYTYAEGNKLFPFLTAAYTDSGTNTTLRRNFLSTLVAAETDIKVLTDAATIVVNALWSDSFAVTLNVAGATRAMGTPSNPTPGQRISFTIIQDGTGGRALTWPAIFKQSWSDTGNTLNKRSTIAFVYGWDGTANFWNQDGAQTPYT